MKQSGGVAATLAAVLLWGSAFTGISIALEGFSPAGVTLARFGLASLALAVVGAIAGVGLPERAHWPRLVWVSLCGITAYHVMLNFGMTRVPPTVTSLLIQTSPIFTALLARAFLQERLPGLAWGGIGLAAGGAVVLVLSKSEGGASMGAHGLLILGCAVVTSLYFVGQQALSARYGAFAVTVWSFAVGTAPMLLFAPALAADVASAPARSVAALVYIGLLPAALAYGLWNYGLRQLGPTRASVFLYLSPVVAVVTEALLLGTTPDALAWVGGALALVGVVLVQRARRSQKRGGDAREQERSKI